MGFNPGFKGLIRVNRTYIFKRKATYRPKNDKLI